MFHIGTLNPNHKMNAEGMHEELLEHAWQGELEDELPKISTIVNWITRLKKKMAEESLCA